MTTPMMILCLRSQPRAQLRSLWLRPPRHSTSIMRVTSTGACLGFQAEATGAPPLGTTCGTGTRFRDSVVSRGSGSFLQASLGDAREDYLRNRASCASAPAGLKRLTRLRASFIRRQVSYRALQGWDLRGLLAQVLLFPLLPQPVTQTETAGCHYWLWRFRGLRAPWKTRLSFNRLQLLLGFSAAG